MLRIFLKTSNHQVKQFLAKPLSLLLISEDVDVSMVKAFKHLAKYHTIHINSQKVYVSLLLHIIQLLTGALSQFLLFLSHEHHYFIGCSIFFVDSVFYVSVIWIIFDKSSIKICKLYLFIVKQDILRAQITMNYSHWLQLNQSFCDLARILSNLFLSKIILSRNVFGKRPAIHLLKYETYVFDLFWPTIGQLQALIEK